jgi:hypothetical protein
MLPHLSYRLKSLQRGKVQLELLEEQGARVEEAVAL